MNAHRPRISIKSTKNIGMNDCIESFRGYGRVLEAREEQQRSGGTTWNILFNIHDKTVRVLKRNDGVLFVNCAGRTALLTRSLVNLRTSVALALRSTK
jgi:hypothetical protein